MTPFILGIVGDSGSGKTTVADAVEALLGPERVTNLVLDDYIRYTREERRARGITALNPTVHNLSLMQEHLQLLRQGRSIRNRRYDHSDGTFGPIRSIEPREVVLVRGLLGYASDEVRDLYHLAVFLAPESELLFRWKLRRDVHSRGYTEAEVLKSIARHLLDSKQYVLPQAERADVLVRHELPDWEASDAEVRTSLLLRRHAAEAMRESGALAGLQEEVGWEDRGEEIEIVLPLALSGEAVNRWAAERFPGSFSEERVGGYLDDHGGPQRRAQLAVVEVLIAWLVEALRARMPPE